MKLSTENWIICLLLLIAGNTSHLPLASILFYIAGSISGIVAMVYLAQGK